MRALIYMVLGVLLTLFGAYNLYGGYELENPMVAALGFGSIIVGAMAIMLGISRRKTKSPQAQSPETPIEDEAHSDIQQENADSGQAEYRALVQSMGVVAVADKRIRQVEVDTIIRIISEMLGTRMSDRDVRAILGEFDDHFDIEETLERNRNHISPMMKRTILQCCQKVMVSDLEVDPNEEKRIHEIGIALGMDPGEIEGITASPITSHKI